MDKKKPSDKVIPKPTFDEWYKAAHMGFSFDAHYLKQGDDKAKAFLALTKEIRNYVSDMVKE